MKNIIDKILRKRKQHFDEATYLRLHPDVAAAVKLGTFASGYNHYISHGKSEGRELEGLNGISKRSQKILSGLDVKGLGLEIGPSHNPVAPKKLGFNVHTLDHLDAPSLRRKYAGHGVNLENIEDVDYVWSGQPLPELIGNFDHYDWIVASHVIEHVPDVVRFLADCEKLLKLGGRLSLVIPDKRYCFDCLGASSSTGDILDAFHEKRKAPSPGQVFDHFSNACSLDGAITWDHKTINVDRLKRIHSFDEAKANYIEAQSNAKYIDVHCWRFTPASCSIVLDDLRGLGLTGFRTVQQYDTAGCEFYVTLSKTGSSGLHK